MINNQTDSLQSWIDRHGKLFVSHATNNHGVILKKGVLKCAEEILLTEKNCEHEQSGHRHTTTLEQAANLKIGHLFEMIYFERKSKKTNAPKVTYLVPKYAQEMIFGKDGIKIFLDKGQFTLKERDLFLEFKSFPGESEAITSSFDIDIREKTSSEEENPYEPFNIQISTMQHSTSGKTLSDIKSERPHQIVDDTLRAIWKYCQKKKVCPDRLEYALYGLRNRVIGLDIRFHIGCDIRVAKNSIWWPYGVIAVLIGNPLSKIGSRYFSDQDFLNQDSDGREFRLKAPYQLDVGYYQLKLDDEENLILGPKAILDSYRSDPEIPASLKSRFVDIESLTSEQKALFSLKAS